MSNTETLLARFQASGAESCFHDRHINPQIYAGLNGRNWRLASEGFEEAIRRIDEAIKDLEKTKEALHKSANNLRLANDKADDLTIKKFEGNPAHPGSRGRNCAKGPATVNQVNDPERILTPLRRVGERGAGQCGVVEKLAAV